MATNVVLATLKFLAILTAGLLGVVGLLVDFKKDGKVTQWGRRALIGTIISTVVAVFIQSIETYKQNIEGRHQNEARLEQEKRNETTLHEIRRGLYLIKDAELSATIRIPKPPDEVKAYLKRINSHVLKNQQYADEEQDDRYLLLEDKKAYPRPVSERVAYTALMRPDIVLRIFKDRRKSDCFWKGELAERSSIKEVVFPQDSKLSGVLPNYLIDRSCEPDLELQIEPPAPANVSISVGVAKGQVLLHLRSLHATVTESRGGQVASISDLVGARLSLELRYGDNDDAWIQETLQSAQISNVDGLRMGASWVRLLKASTNHPGFVFDADFPNNEDALWQRPVSLSPKDK